MVTTREEVKHESVRIKRIVLDLHGVIVDSKMVVLFEYEEPLLSWVENWWMRGSMQVWELKG